MYFQRWGIFLQCREHRNKKGMKHLARSILVGTHYNFAILQFCNIQVGLLLDGGGQEFGQDPDGPALRCHRSLQE
jgi:hypothetical protein